MPLVRQYINKQFPTDAPISFGAIVKTEEQTNASRNITSLLVVTRVINMFDYL